MIVGSGESEFSPFMPNWVLECQNDPLFGNSRVDVEVLPKLGIDTNEPFICLFCRFGEPPFALFLVANNGSSDVFIRNSC